MTPETHALPDLARLIERYGDALYDLTQSVLRDPTEAQIAFKEILKLLTRDQALNPYRQFEQGFIFRVACEHLEKIAKTRGKPLSPDLQIRSDQLQTTQERLGQLDDFFRRLLPRDQLLLLLKDKLALSYGDIAMALGEPEETLKLRRSQALQSLEEWIWPRK